MDNIFMELSTAFWKGIIFVLKAFLPLIIGLIIAYLLNGPVEYIGGKLNRTNSTLISVEKPKGRILSILITYLIVSILVISIFFAFVVLMLGTLPSGNIEETLSKLYEYVSSSEIISHWIEKHFSPEKLINIASKLAASVINFLLGVVASIYLLKDKEFFLGLWQQFLSIILNQKTHGIISEICHEINIVITTFLKGAFVDSIIVALLSSTVLSLLKIKYAAIIGIIGGLLNVIPYFGPFFGMVPAFLMALTTQGITKAIVAVIALFAVQQLDSNYIYPKIVGTTTGLHPLFVLLSVSVMGYFAGILGMLIAVPLAGIIQVIIKKWAYNY